MNLHASKYGVLISPMLTRSQFGVTCVHINTHQIPLILHHCALSNNDSLILIPQLAGEPPFVDFGPQCLQSVPAARDPAIRAANRVAAACAQSPPAAQAYPVELNTWSPAGLRTPQTYVLQHSTDLLLHAVPVVTPVRNIISSQAPGIEVCQKWTQSLQERIIITSAVNKAKVRVTLHDAEPVEAG